jgi:hypothetical protein
MLMHVVVSAIMLYLLAVLQSLSPAKVACTSAHRSCLLDGHRPAKLIVACRPGLPGSGGYTYNNNNNR